MPMQFYDAGWTEEALLHAVAVMCLLQQQEPSCRRNRDRWPTRGIRQRCGAPKAIERRAAETVTPDRVPPERDEGVDESCRRYDTTKQEAASWWPFARKREGLAELQRSRLPQAAPRSQRRAHAEHCRRGSADRWGPEV